MLTDTLQISHYASTVLGASRYASLTLLLIVNALGVPGRIIPAALASRFGPLNTLGVLTMLCCVLFLAWMRIDTLHGMYAFAAVFGLAMSGVQGMGQVTLAELTADPAKMGTRCGMILSTGAFGALTGSPIAGALIDAAGGSFRYLQIWGGAVMIVSSAVLFAAQRPLARQRAADVVQGEKERKPQNSVTAV